MIEVNTKNRIRQNATSSTKTEEDAKNDFEQWKQTDPFPKIAPALLNSADILAYVEKTSLIYPFDKRQLKGASYDVAIEGDVVYWDNTSGEKKIVSLMKDGDGFDLFPNSIAFVTLQPTFRIPYYIALRFNLKITHIYKGLLLGTGPLVDPGFQGKLSIPLHNLTSNTYHFRKGDFLITMEFTKMSANQLWEAKLPFVGHQEAYRINDIKADRRVEEYITKALAKDCLNSVISSSPSALMEGKRDVAEAKAAVEKVEKKANLQAAVSIVAVCSLVISCVGLSLNAVNKANERYDYLKEEFRTIKEAYEGRIAFLENKLIGLNLAQPILDEGNRMPMIQENTEDPEEDK